MKILVEYLLILLFISCNKASNLNSGDCVNSNDVVFKIKSINLTTSVCSVEVMQDFEETTGQKFKKGEILEMPYSCKVYEKWNKISC